MRWEAAGGRRHIRDSEAVFCHLNLSLNFLVNNDKTPGLGNETVGLSCHPGKQGRHVQRRLL